MLLWILWIASVTLLKSSQGDLILPVFPPERSAAGTDIDGKPASKNYDQFTQQKSKPTDVGEEIPDILLPMTKPQKVFPKPTDQNSTVNIYSINSENSQKPTKNDKSKSQFNKNENGKVLIEKETIKKSDDSKTTREKLTINKSENVTTVTNSDDVSVHGIAASKFPKHEAMNVSDVIHGERIPVLAEKLPTNSSLPGKEIELTTNKVPIKPGSILPKASKPLNPQNNEEHIEIIKNKGKDEKNEPSEAKDLNSKTKYLGECDVDEVKHIANATSVKKCIPKTNSTENKKEISESSTIPGQHPESEILTGFNRTAPHSISEEKDLKQLDINDSGHKLQQSVHINSDKVSEKIVMAPAEENHKKSSIFRSAGNGVTIFVILLATLALFSYVGLIVWRKIMLRRSGREILINEDEFCEDCPDSQLEMNQQNNRNIII